MAPFITQLQMGENRGSGEETHADTCSAGQQGWIQNPWLMWAFVTSISCI